MKLSPLRPSRHQVAALAAALGLAVLAVPTARAFTMDNQSNTNSDGSTKFSDPGLTPPSPSPAA